MCIEFDWNLIDQSVGDLLLENGIWVILYLDKLVVRVFRRRSHSRENKDNKNVWQIQEAEAKFSQLLKDSMQDSVDQEAVEGFEENRDLSLTSDH